MYKYDKLYKEVKAQLIVANINDAIMYKYDKLNKQVKAQLKSTAVKQIKV